jgi:acyl-CoA dehydrogenase
MMDTVSNKEAKAEIAMIKIAVLNMACKVVDWAIQAFGGEGTSNDFGLAAAYATARMKYIRDQLARTEFEKQRSANARGGVDNRTAAVSNRALSATV